MRRKEKKRSSLFTYKLIQLSTVTPFEIALVISINLFSGRTYEMVVISCKNKTISTLPIYNKVIFTKYLQLFNCLINSPIASDLNKKNLNIDSLEKLELTNITTYTALDEEYMKGLPMDTLTVKALTMLPTRRHALYSLKNLTNLELTNVVLPDIPDGVINLSLREIKVLPVQLTSCKNLKQLKIIHWNVDYIYEGFLANCANLKAVFIEFGKNRFNLHHLFDGSNITLDYLEIHDPKLSHVLPMQLSAINFTGLTELKELNLSYNKISSLSK